jgi:hypothetical protein
MLDAFPMLLAFVALNVMHPGYVLQGPDGDFPRLTRAEKKALKQEKKDAKRRKREEKRDRKAGAKGHAAGEYMNTEDIALEDGWRRDSDNGSLREPQPRDFSRADHV